MRAAITLLVLAIVGCQAGPAIPDLEQDLTLLHPLPLGAPPPAVTPEMVVERTQGDHEEPIEPLRLGRRLA